MANQLFNLFSFGKSVATETVKAIAPYQPYIATATILGKIGWKYREEQKLKNEVVDLSTRIARINRVLKTPRNAEDALRMRTKLKDLTAQRNEKERQIEMGRLSFWQVPSLFFSHPGANPYLSLHQIYQRGVAITHQVDRDGASRTATIATIAACTLSMTGTAASLLRLMDVVEQDDPIANYLATAALAVHLTEGALTAASGIRSAYNRYLAK